MIKQHITNHLIQPYQRIFTPTRRSLTSKTILRSQSTAADAKSMTRQRSQSSLRSQKKKKMTQQQLLMFKLQYSVIDILWICKRVTKVRRNIDKTEKNIKRVLLNYEVLFTHLEMVMAWKQQLKDMKKPIK